MFTQIKTSRQNKAVVTSLTRRLNLGTENIIARMALTYSLSQDRKLELAEIQDSDGKEYSRNVLFGKYEDIYLGLVCNFYGISITDRNLAKYIKIHIDDGLQLINSKLSSLNNIDGFDFILELISDKVEH